MKNINPPLFHIEHPPLIRRQLHAMYTKSAGKFIITKYSIPTFFTFLSVVLIPIIFTSQVESGEKVLDYIASFVIASILTLGTTFFILVISQLVFFIKGKFLLRTEKVFSFFKNYVVIKSSHNKNKTIQYDQLEYIQEKNGFDFFYPHSKGLSRVIGLSKSQVKERDAYEDFLKKIKNNTFKNKTLFRGLSLLVLGLSDERKRLKKKSL